MYQFDRNWYIACCVVLAFFLNHREFLGQCTRRSEGTAHEGGGATSQLDLPSLTPLSAAGCGRLQLGVPHLATSVDYCK